jgi:hypothetical protein
MDTGLPLSPAPAPAPPRAPDRLSDLLETLAQGGTDDRIRLSDILRAMEGRAFGALLLIFAFPNMLPSPPGLAGVLGLPLLFLSAQMMLGMAPWLPAFIAERSISRSAFAAFASRARPWLQRAERLLRARLAPLTTPFAQRLVGAVAFVVAIALVLPIPFANLVPAFAICVLALGIIERDGLWIAGGLVAAAGALAYVGVLGYALVKSAVFLILNAF